MKPRSHHLLFALKKLPKPQLGVLLLSAAIGGLALAEPARLTERQAAEQAAEQAVEQAVEQAGEQAGEAAWKPVQKAKKKASSVANVKATFQKLDSNKDGFVSAAEAKAWKVPAAAFKRHDVNATKSICPDEFVVLYKDLLLQAGRPVTADLAAEVARIMARRRMQESRKEKERPKRREKEAKEAKGKKPVARQTPAPTPSAHKNFK